MTHDETAREESRESTGGRIDDGDLSALEQELTQRREPFARATVVRREQPASANVGDRALVTADGELHGWVGGAACAQSIVATQGRDAIETDTPRLVGIAPDPDTVDRPGLEAFPMTCHSDGVLEVFIEPVTPTTELVIVGDSPVARSLARLASELAFDIKLVVTDGDAPEVPETVEIVSGVDPEAAAADIGPGALVVVASMGQYDARGIAIGALADAPYIGLIASDERAKEEIERAAGLLDRDVEIVAAAVTNPAGVDIAAYTPAELAASLLAEVVDVRSRRTPGEATGEETAAVETDPDSDGGSADEADEGDADDSEPTDAALDPVCGMTVDPTDAAASVQYDGETYYFCCHGCADSFDNEPESYLEEEVHS